MSVKSRSRSWASKQEGGFTLIEVMIAMIVMVIGLAGVMMMQSASVKGNRHAARFTRAAAIAEEVMEELRGRPVVVLEAGEAATIPPQVIGGVTYDIDYQVDNVGAQVNLVMVTVLISYGEDGDTADLHTARLQMVRTRQEAL